MYIKTDTDNSIKPWGASSGIGYKQITLVCELWCFLLHKPVWRPQSHHHHKKTPGSWLCCQWNYSMWDTAEVCWMRNHPPLSLCEIRCGSLMVPIIHGGEGSAHFPYKTTKFGENLWCLLCFKLLHLMEGPVEITINQPTNQPTN